KSSSKKISTSFYTVPVITKKTTTSTKKTSTTIKTTAKPISTSKVTSKPTSTGKSDTTKHTSTGKPDTAKHTSTGKPDTIKHTSTTKSSIKTSATIKPTAKASSSSSAKVAPATSTPNKIELKVDPTTSTSTTTTLFNVIAVITNIPTSSTAPPVVVAPLVDSSSTSQPSTSSSSTSAALSIAAILPTSSSADPTTSSSSPATLSVAATVTTSAVPTTSVDSSTPSASNTSSPIKATDSSSSVSASPSSITSTIESSSSVGASSNSITSATDLSSSVSASSSSITSTTDLSSSVSASSSSITSTTDSSSSVSASSSSITSSSSSISSSSSSISSSSSTSVIPTPTPLIMSATPKVLVISQSGDELPVVNTLKSYNTPYDLFYTTATGFAAPLPPLYSGTTAFYNVIIITFLPFYDPVALQPIMTYLSRANAKLIRLNDIPDSTLGVVSATGAGYDNGQTISFANSTFAVYANLQPTLVLSSTGLFHTPVNITDTTLASPVLYYDAVAAGPNYQTVAAVLIQNPTGGPPFQQLSFYIPFATWSPTSTFLNSVWYAWGMNINLTPADISGSVEQRVLILTKPSEANTSTIILQAYGIPYDVVEVPQTGLAGSLILQADSFTGLYSLI
ncbi:hypothetical protein HDU76_005683, partial [Blyttiomyces sp. JEL0837]